jgi:hypothetical protein
MKHFIKEHDAVIGVCNGLGYSSQAVTVARYCSSGPLLRLPHAKGYTPMKTTPFFVCRQDFHTLGLMTKKNSRTSDNKSCCA